MNKIKLITVSRDFGTDADEIVERVAKKVNGEIIDKQKILNHLKEKNINVEELIKKEKELIFQRKDKEFIENYKEYIKKGITEIIKEKDSILFLLGRGGQFLFKDEDYAFHLNIFAPLEFRIKYLAQKYLLPEEKAFEIIKEKDFEREIFYNVIFGNNWKNPYLYNLAIDRSAFTPPEIEDMILRIVEKKEVPKILFEQIPLPTKPNFANKSEEEFAKILSFYQIKWEYEPRTFPLEWDSEGNIIESFTPDFYLPDFDLYIELTLQKPRVMSEKLKKIKKLKELYPNVKIKLFYGKEYEKLLAKFGIKEIR
ncbi:MAG: cytidylate kinase family protein [Dictyoglomus thermophilum]|nr:cytidylate kinase family protein [Dictyoglomus thermophilum]MCX7720742.1 cytidylate kinase family protein [Dictyoglomus thermophilum]